MAKDANVVVVGGGMSGLACASVLEGLSLNYTVIESSDRLGGKVRTDMVDGYLLDQGFQVVLPNYPEIRRFFDLESLELQYFPTGIMIDSVLGSPTYLGFSQPTEVLRSARRLIGSIDLAATARNLIKERSWRAFVNGANSDELLRTIPRSAPLRYGLLEPLIRGITADDRFEVPTDFIYEVARTMARGGVGIPSVGMARLPQLLETQLQGGRLLNTKVLKVDSGGVVLQGGERVNADAVVVATDATSAAQLIRGLPPVAYRGLGYAYYTTSSPVLNHPCIYVPSLRRSAIMTITDISRIAPRYSTTDKTLLSVSFLPNLEMTEAQLTQELRSIVGPREDLAPLALGVISEALPVRNPSYHDRPDRALVGANIVLAGDYLESPSINGALASGRRAARAVAAKIFGQGSYAEPIAK